MASSEHGEIKERYSKRVVIIAGPNNQRGWSCGAQRRAGKKQENKGEVVEWSAYWLLRERKMLVCV